MRQLVLRGVGRLATHLSPKPVGMCGRVATHKAQQMEALVHKWVGYAREMNEVRALQEKRAGAIEDNTAALQGLMQDARALKEEADGKVGTILVSGLGLGWASGEEGGRPGGGGWRGERGGGRWLPCVSSVGEVRHKEVSTTAKCARLRVVSPFGEVLR